MPKAKDLTGQKFGHLTAIRPTKYRNSSGMVMWECSCDCGSHKLVSTYQLTSGGTISCGHIRKTAHLRTQITGTALKSSRTGVLGVSRDGETGRYLADLSVGGKSKLHKRFDTLQEAINARREAEQLYFEPKIEAVERMTEVSK